MQSGWECQRCHNIYSPTTPFCLYCWFQNNKNIETVQIQKTIIQNQIKQQQISTKKNKIILTEKEEIYNNKNLQLQSINIQIPVLNKQPNHPLSSKYPDTKIYLSGIGHAKQRAINRTFKVPYILDSIIDLPVQPSKLVRQYFDYLKKNEIEYMLDSGAFSYMNNPKKSFNLKEHLKQYCYYINQFDIQDFIQLDLDVFMSIDEIENIRKKIYLQTHKQPIIVFHEERGHDYWINMCKENDFVAIGGLVIGTETNSIQRFERLSVFCEEAHTYNTRVHGLGFTPLALLNTRTMFFDTVDSTTWNFTKYGNSAILNDKGELIKGPPINTFSTIEAQELDLKVWATFATNYKGTFKK